MCRHAHARDFLELLDHTKSQATRESKLDTFMLRFDHYFLDKCLTLKLSFQYGRDGMHSQDTRYCAEA